MHTHVRYLYTCVDVCAVWCACVCTQSKHCCVGEEGGVVFIALIDIFINNHLSQICVYERKHYCLWPLKINDKVHQHNTHTHTHMAHTHTHTHHTTTHNIHTHALLPHTCTLTMAWGFAKHTRGENSFRTLFKETWRWMMDIPVGGACVCRMMSASCLCVFCDVYVCHV